MHTIGSSILSKLISSFRMTVILLWERVLRAASTHYPVLRKFLQQSSSARTSHKYIFDIDKALCTGEYHRLMEITQSNGFESLISNDGEASYEQCTDVAGGDLVLRQPNLEAQLLISHAELISQLEDEVQDFPEYACCRCQCERLHQRKSLTRINLSDDLSHDVWPHLKSYMLEQTPDAGDHVLFMCKYCRQEKLCHSEYIKSRLLNRDSRFRKAPQYVLYLLWQKEMRELSAGVYNLLKSTRRHPMSVSMFLDSVEASNEHLEANLSTMLQSVRGTKQYWFLRPSELKCMIREWGSPTLFLTFGCAEYESPDITEFLRRVNDVSSGYNIGKLCTEVPISVFRQFSLKFHAFFRIVLLKGEVLGKVDHFYWKKEYQAHGAPHYHVLLWIQDAPVIGRDDPDQVLACIQDRITCHIPDKNCNPELHGLVTRYQLHKCSKYCKQRKKCGKHTFITRCRFGFPRQACDSAKLNPVQQLEVT